ncbi:MAG: TolC family protein, partial [Phycisphaerales bacterium]|nr:TolC family protein [Phycisphaerales bacterium]
WALFGQRQALVVREEEYRVAEAQLARAQRQFNAGSVAQIEVTRAESGLADRIDGIIRARTNITTAQRELKRIINIPGLDVESGTELVPTSPPDPARFRFDRDALAAEAVDQRMEMLELELRLLADASSIQFARNQTLPLLSLQALYRLNGLGPDFGESIETTAENEFEDWSLSLNASIPIGNEAALARLRQAVLTRVQRLNTRAARAQLIRQEVFDAIDEVEAGWQRIMAARQSVVLNVRSLEAEQRQFDVGASTSTDVLDASAALAVARLAEIQAIVDYQIALVDLAAATGTLIGSARVRWEPTPYDPAMGEFVPDSLREPWAARSAEGDEG